MRTEKGWVDYPELHTGPYNDEKPANTSWHRKGCHASLYRQTLSIERDMQAQYTYYTRCKRVFDNERIMVVEKSQEQVGTKNVRNQ